MLLNHVHVVTDMTVFLPKAATHRQHLLVEQMQSGPAARAIMVSLDNAPPEVLAHASNRLAIGLAQSSTFGLIANGAHERQADDRNWLFTHRYLLSRSVTTERFKPEGLREALSISRERLGTQLGDMFRPLIARDPTGELLNVLEGLDFHRAPATRHGVWFDKSGSKALLLLEVRISATTVELQEKIKNEIEATFATLASPGMRMILAGPAIYAVESRNLIERESLIFTLLATILIVLLLACVYRSLMQMILVCIPAASGALAAVVMVSWYYGSLHGITLAFAIILLAETIDYPSYLFLQISPEKQLIIAAQDIWPTLRLAVLTSLVGSFAMVFSGIEGLSQLGLLTVTGIGVAGLVIRWVVPAMTPARHRIVLSPFVIPEWLRITLRPNPWLAGGIVALAFLAFSAGGLSWENNLGALSPLPTEMKLRDRQLREQLDAPDVRFVIMLTGLNAEQVLRDSENLRPMLDNLVQEKLFLGYEMAANYLPSRATQLLRLAALPDINQLRIDLPSAAHDAGFRPDVLTPFIDEVAHARRLAPISIHDIPNKAWRLRVESLLFTHASNSVALITLKGVVDAETLASHAGKLAPALLIDLKQEIGELIISYRDQIILYSAAGIILIGALVFAHLRDVVTTLRVILPSFLGIFCATAILQTVGEALNLFHLVSLLLVLGVGINYALFFNRPGINASDEDRVLCSLLICLTTTLIGFGALAASSIPILHSIGITTFSGTAFSFGFAAWLAPRRQPQPRSMTC